MAYETEDWVFVKTEKSRSGLEGEIRKILFGRGNSEGPVWKGKFGRLSVKGEKEGEEDRRWGLNKGAVKLTTAPSPNLLSPSIKN